MIVTYYKYQHKNKPRRKNCQWRYIIEFFCKMEGKIFLKKLMQKYEFIHQSHESSIKLNVQPEI